MQFINKFTILPTQRKMIINKLKEKNMIPIFDYLLENCKGNNKFTYISTIINHLQEFPNYPIAIKLSSFGNYWDIENVNTFVKFNELSNNVIYMDAEQCHVPDKLIVKECWSRKLNIAKTYQMYKKNEIKILENDIKNYGNSMHYKLVRGAYWHEEKDNGKLFTNKQHTDNQYNNAIDISKHLETVLYATHNEKSLSLVPNGKKVAQLLGMGDHISESMSNTHKVYKYVPFGSYKESIPYLIRRLYENNDTIKYLFK